LHSFRSALPLPAFLFIVSIKRLAAVVLVFAAFGGACERQSYQETRNFTHHGESAAHAKSEVKPEQGATTSADKPVEHKRP
jgi:hypothetical protein